MSDASTTVNAPATGAPGVVNQWQSQLQAAFGSVAGDSSHEHFTEIREGFAAGRFGGLPLEGPIVDALILFLEQVGWAGATDRLARAMPHFPEVFHMQEACNVLSRLDFETRDIVRNEDSLRPEDCPALLVNDPLNPRVVDFIDGEPRIVRSLPADFMPLPGGRLELIRVRRARPAEEGPAKGSWLGTQLRTFRNPIGLLLAITGFVNMMVLVTSFTVMTIYDSVIPTGSLDTLTAILIGLFVAVAIELAFRRLKARLIGRLCGRLEYLVGTSIFAKLLSLPADMIAAAPIGAQMTRLGQFETIRDLFAGPFAAIVLEIPYVFLFVCLLFAIGGPLGYIAVALIIVYAVLGAATLPALRRRVLRSSRLRQERQALMLETATNIRTIRAAGCEDIWAKRLDDTVERASEAHRAAQRYGSLLSTLSGAGVPVAGGATVAAGAALVMSGDLSTGVLVGAMIVIWRILSPIQQAFMALTKVADMASTVRQIDQMMRIPAAEKADDSPVRRQFAGKVSFDRVAFRYPGATDASLAGISLDIEPGEFIAVVGSSGAGKTTLLRLILNLYQLQSGVVSLDGINVRQIPPVDLRSGVGYVPHSIALFHGSISQNLRLAAPSADDAALRRVAEELGILNVIDGLPKGFDTLIDHETRDRLPTGFQQSLSIAQAMLRNPQVLLFDEPAQALDPTIETHFLDAVARRRGRVTILMVTHRPSHATLADRVLALDRGQVAAFDKPSVVLRQPAPAGGANG